MNIPEFRDDAEMAEWAEANNLDATDLEDADDEVFISQDVSVAVMGWLYSPVGAIEGGTTTSSPSATEQERELVPN